MIISEDLWAGGLPQTSEWNNQGGYWSRDDYFDGTVTANAAPNLIDYLEEHFSVTWTPLGKMNAGNNDVPEAKPGDIIAYDWNDDGIIDHLSFVVGDSATDSEYPLVSEWGQFANYSLGDYASNPRSPYVERGWSWSAINNEWLQSESGHRNMTAYLLHFNGGVDAPSF